MGLSPGCGQNAQKRNKIAAVRTTLFLLVALCEEAMSSEGTETILSTNKGKDVHPMTIY